MAPFSYLYDIVLGTTLFDGHCFLTGTSFDCSSFFGFSTIPDDVEFSSETKNKACETKKWGYDWGWGGGVGCHDRYISID